MTRPLRIGIVAPGTRIDPNIAGRVKALAATRYPKATPELLFHPQCYLSSGHFAGDDEARAQAFLEVANDPDIDAVWFARGGYGSCRIAPAASQKLTSSARNKLYLGYSDAGSLLAGLYRARFEHIAHGPMPIDIIRDNGEDAVARALAYLVDRDPASLESSLTASTKSAAFNIMILSALLGTGLEPDLSGHVLMLEEVSEPMYRIDRALFHITSTPSIRRVAGIRLGRCSNILPNDPDFGQTEEDVIRHWCGIAGIAYFGRADIGHDVANKVVPFGQLATA
jgi:muramoyltetrapeptide carboxypeptidase